MRPSIRPRPHAARRRPAAPASRPTAARLLRDLPVLLLAEPAQRLLVDDPPPRMQSGPVPQASIATTIQQIAQNTGYSAPPKFHIQRPSECRHVAHAATSRKAAARLAAHAVKTSRTSPIVTTISIAKAA